MTKTIRLILLFAVLAAAALMLAPGVCAEQDAKQDILDSLRDYAGLDALEDNLPDSLKQSDLQGLDMEDGNLFSAVGGKLADMLLSALGGGLVFFAGLISLIAVSAILSAVGENMSDGTVKSAFTYVSALALCLYLYNYVSQLFSLTAAYLRDINVYVAAVMPSLSLLNAAGGGNATAVIQSSGTASAIAILETLLSSVIAPVMRFSFAFIIVGCIGDIDLSGFARGIRRAATAGISFVMTLLSAVLYLQSGLAAAADGVALRSVRFAASSFVPVIGSMLGDAMGAIFSSIKYLKSAAGLFCIAAVLFLIAVPVIRLTVAKIFLALAEFACSALGLDGQGNLIKEIKDSLNILLAAAAASGVFFILALTVFMRTNLAI